jgi:hypothetical protein
MAETLVRFVDLAASAKQQLPVCVTTRNGQVLNEPEEMFPDWLAISAVEESSLETFVLYWLSLSGEIIDFAQRNTLEEVLAEVSNAVRRSDWRECKVSLSDASEPQIPRALID